MNTKVKDFFENSKVIVVVLIFIIGSILMAIDHAKPQHNERKITELEIKMNKLILDEKHLS